MRGQPGLFDVHLAEPPGPRLRFAATDRAQLTAGVRLLVELFGEGSPT